MNYMLLIYGDELALNQAEIDQCLTESAQVARELDAEGRFRGAAPLLPTSTAKCVQLRDGQRIVTDGPFAETREQLGGYFLIDAETIEDALDIASRIPMCRQGTVEVRQLMPVSGLPGETK